MVNNEFDLHIKKLISDAEDNQLDLNKIRDIDMFYIEHYPVRYAEPRFSTRRKKRLHQSRMISESIEIDEMLSEMDTTIPIPES
jgi:hypothetical protein